MSGRILSPEKFTYSAATGAFSSVASATDIFEIRGAADKRIRVINLVVSCSQTTGGEAVIKLLKRSTADSGGTSANATKVPHSSKFPASTATVKSYTANPTTGTLVGAVFSGKVYIPATTEVIQPFVEFNLEQLYGAPVTLFDATESLVVNLNGVTITGGSFDITVTWIEEPTQSLAP